MVDKSGSLTPENRIVTKSQFKKLMKMLRDEAIEFTNNGQWGDIEEEEGGEVYNIVRSEILEKPLPAGLKKVPRYELALALSFHSYEGYKFEDIYDLRPQAFREFEYVERSADSPFRTDSKLYQETPPDKRFPHV